MLNKRFLLLLPGQKGNTLIPLLIFNVSNVTILHIRSMHRCVVHRILGVFAHLHCVSFQCLFSVHPVNSGIIADLLFASAQGPGCKSLLCGLQNYCNMLLGVRLPHARAINLCWNNLRTYEECRTPVFHIWVSKCLRIVLSERPLLSSTVNVHYTSFL